MTQDEREDFFADDAVTFGAHADRDGSEQPKPYDDARCGFTIVDQFDIEQPCDRPATGWRWYQGHDHEDSLDAACVLHANEGGRRIHEAEAKVARVEALADDLAATVALLLYDAHPVYGSTATWRGGIGGASMTQGCSFIDPPPGADWLEVGMPSIPLREWIDYRGDFDLDGAKGRMKAKFRAALEGGDDA